MRPRWPLRVVAAAWLRQHSQPLIVAGLIISLAYYYLVDANLLALPGLLVFIWLTWRRLDLALCVLPLSFPFWYVPKRVYGGYVLPLSEVALVVCFAVALLYEARHVRAGLDHARIWTRAYLLGHRVGVRVMVGAGLLFAGATIGVVIAGHPHEALRAYRWEIVEPMLYALGLLLYVRGRSTAQVLVWSFLAAATLLALLAIAQVTAIHHTYSSLAQGNRLVPYTVPGGSPHATAFVFGSPNNLGAWIERAAPLALALGLSVGGGRRSRFCALACLAVGALALYWTGSRGAWIGAGLGCAVVLCVHIGKRWLPLALGGGAAALLLWQRTAFTHALLSGHNNTGSLRLLIWLAGLKMIRDHPIFGLGPDQFLYRYSNLYTAHPYWVTTLGGKPTIVTSQPWLAHPHNLLLDLWISGGVLAVVGFSALLWTLCQRYLALWRAGRRAPLNERAAWCGAVALGIIGALVAGVAHGIVDSAYFFPDLALIFWMMVALLIGLERLLPPLGNISRIPRDRSS